MGNCCTQEKDLKQTFIDTEQPLPRKDFQNEDKRIIEEEIFHIEEELKVLDGERNNKHNEQERMVLDKRILELKIALRELIIQKEHLNYSANQAEVNVITRNELPRQYAPPVQTMNAFRNNNNDRPLGLPVIYDEEESFSMDPQLTLAERLRDYDSIVYDKIKREKFHTKYLDSLGLETYNEGTFIILDENFWENAFIQGSRGFQIKKRQNILIKEALLQVAIDPNIKYDDEIKWKLADKATSILREKEILTLLSKSGDGPQYFSECEGCFYKKTLYQTNKVASVLLLSSVGDANLEQIMIKRKELGKSYTEVELLSLFKHLIKGLKILQENRIYHSNIRTKRIYVDLLRNNYFFFDFSFAKLIPIDAEGKNIFNISEYGKSGAIGYISPEKQEAWDLYNSTKIINKEKKFNPFKDDVWGLGVCFKELAQSTKILEGSNLDAILKKMLVVDWAIRPDAIELDKFVEKLTGVDHTLHISNEEKFIAKLIKNERILNNPDPKKMYKKLEEAQLIEEQKEFLQIHFKENGKKTKELEAWLNLQEGKLLNRLGEKQKALETLEKSLKIYNENNLEKKRAYEVGHIHLINFEIYKDFGDYYRASEYIAKALELQISIGNLDTFPLIEKFHAGLWQSVKGNYKAVAMTFKERAKLFCCFGQYERAKQEYYRAIQAFEAVKQDLSNSEIELEIVRTQLDTHSISLDEAEFCMLQDCRKNFERIFQTNLHLDVAKTIYYITAAGMKLSSYSTTACLENIEMILRIYSKILKNDHPDVRNAENWKDYLENLDKSTNTKSLEQFNLNTPNTENEITNHNKENAEATNTDTIVDFKRDDDLDQVLSEFKDSNKVNSMTTQIETLVERHLLTKDYLINNLKIKEYPNKKYKKLNLLGKGSFGEVWRGMDVDSRKMMALKFVFLKKGLANISEKEEGNLAGLLREQEIHQKLKSRKSTCFCELIDIYYINDSSDNISALVMVTTAGNCSLKDLLTVRQKEKSKKEGATTQSPYSKQEGIIILKDVSEAMLHLHELKIYHSDIKPENIVYNADLKKYQLIDFGVSKVVVEKEKISDIPTDEKGEAKIYLEDYGNGGTNRYFSPEKEYYWELVKQREALIEGDENEKILNKAIEALVFDPFKCDLYSLGKSIADLFAGSTEISEFPYLAPLLVDDFNDRISAKDLFNQLESDLKNKNVPGTAHPENFYLEIIEKNRWKTSFSDYYRKFDEAFMLTEQLALVEEELNQAQDRSEDFNKILEIKFRRGLTLKKSGRLVEAQDQFQKVLEEQKKAKLEDKKNIANSLIALASISSERGEYQTTKEFLEEALALLRDVHKSENHLEIIKVKQQLAIQKGKLGHFGDAAFELQALIDNLIECFHLDKNVSTYLAIANTMLEQSKQWGSLHQYERAISQIETVLEMRKNAFSTEIHPDVAEAMHEIVKQKMRMMSPENLIESLEKILKIRRSLYKSDYHPTIAETLYSLAQVQFYQNNIRQSVDLFKNVTNIYKRIFKSDEHPSVYCSRVWLEYLYPMVRNEQYSQNIYQVPYTIVAGGPDSGSGYTDINAKSQNPYSGPVAYNYVIREAPFTNSSNNGLQGSFQASSLSNAFRGSSQALPMNNASGTTSASSMSNAFRGNPSASSMNNAFRGNPSASSMNNAYRVGSYLPPTNDAFGGATYTPSTFYATQNNSKAVSRNNVFRPSAFE